MSALCICSDFFVETSPAMFKLISAVSSLLGPLPALGRAKDLMNKNHVWDGSNKRG